MSTLSRPLNEEARRLEKGFAPRNIGEEEAEEWGLGNHDIFLKFDNTIVIVTACVFNTIIDVKSENVNFISLHVS